LAVALPACADDKSDSASAARAIRAAAKDYRAAMLRGDVETLSRMWTPNGDYVDASGQMLKAQELIREQVAASSPDVAAEQVPMPDSSLRFVTPEVAIEDGTTDYGISADGSEVAGRFTAVWVNRDGRWLLDSLREATASSPTPNDRLQPLAWLIGEWVGKTDDSAMLVSSHWSEQGSYIVRNSIVRADGGEALSGTERIGWDPIAGRIKSWTFDSQGGSGEGRWRRDGERWVIDCEEVMSDGGKASTSIVYSPGDEGSYLWEVKSAQAAGVNLPPMRVDFKRAKDDQ
jgi:uncharacterized protein (TIGR02246 family)